MVEETPKLYKATRFWTENISPILQHYGIQTPWIDLVDNIYIAIWFATHRSSRRENGFVEFVKSEVNHGWIYFFETTIGVRYYDLREHHSSLSLRLHVQHGISATRTDGFWDTSNRFLDEFVIAKVKIPNDEPWLLTDKLFTTQYLFPPVYLDNTYKYLQRKKFKELIEVINTKYDLDPQELGNIVNYAS